MGSSTSVKRSPALYIHIPFCRHKCSYCDFYSLTDTSRQKEFLSALRTETGNVLLSGFSPETIFVGGGTPTLFEPSELAEFLSIVRDHVSTDRLVEWTMEANPETVTPEKAELLKEAGVNRVSLGAQSFQPHLLEKLERLTTPEGVVKAYRLLREHGFDNLNLDLIFAAPGATLEDWDRDLDAVISLAPDHVSAYNLTFEERTPMGERHKRGEIPALPEELQIAMYERTQDRMDRAGYRQYEVSNYARPGRECRHNLHYWRQGEYFALGPSASYFIDGVRGSNVRSLPGYIEQVGKQGHARGEEERLDSEQLLREKVALAMRTTEGMEKVQIETLACTILDLPASLDHWIDQGILEETGGRIRPTPHGLLFADEIAVSVL